MKKHRSREERQVSHREFRAFGPPGCGKTTWIAHQVERALYKYHAEDIFCASFTRAAAAELAGRDTGLPERNVGTIHALCYHALDRPAIIETRPALLDKWNADHSHWAVGPSDNIDERQVGGRGTELMRYNRQRARRDRIVEGDPFVDAWEGFKADYDACDFTDLLLNSPESIGAKVLFVDEAQDLTPLQWQVVRAWGERAEVFVVAGDDDQLLYDFLGASPEAFLTPLAEDRIRVLNQSFRLPRAVYEYAERWIDKLAGRRQPKDYEPRNAEGRVTHRSGLSYENPALLLTEILDRLQQGKTIMVLASCSYMLQPLIKQLKTRGVPFHNPYRQKRGNWNPLQHTARRILAFVQCAQHARQDRLLPLVRWWEWIEMVRAQGNLKHGAKREIESRVDSGGSFVWSNLEKWIEAPAADALLATDIDWLCRNVTKRFQDVIEYPATIAKRNGVEALADDPHLIVGTIHSVKGGQADVVYLFPDVSYEAYKEVEARGQSAKDALTRLAYVGMTRAREEVNLCAPSRRFYWRWLN